MRSREDKGTGPRRSRRNGSRKRVVPDEQAIDESLDQQGPAGESIPPPSSLTPVSVPTVNSDESSTPKPGRPNITIRASCSARKFRIKPGF